MALVLKLHPDSVCDAVSSIEVEAVRTSAGALVLRYVLTGTIADLRLPPPTAPARADGLWQHSCFEAFVRAEGATGYNEFNFAASSQWAAYRFDSYRSAMAAAEVGHLTIDVRSGDLLELRAALSEVQGLPDGAAWRLALSSVIEEANGRKSWWALAHPAGKPDFHHPDSFALELPPFSSPRT